MTLPSREALVSFARGLVESFGAPAVETPLVDAPDGKGQLALVRDGYKLQVLPGKQDRFARHVFADIGSFAAWVGAGNHSRNDTDILVDTTEIVAACVVPDALDPDGDIVRCALTSHPRYARWIAELGVLTQRQFQMLVLSSLADFAQVRDQGGKALGSDGSALATQLAQFNAVRTQEASFEFDPRGFVSWSAQTDKTVVSGKIPASFKLYLPVLLGVTKEDATEFEYEVEVFIQVVPAEKGPPSFVLLFPSRLLVEHAARKDAAARLQALLGDRFLVGNGKFRMETVTVQR